ncbi:MULTISPECIES: hypothetical protein [unclassified Arthrobacter]|uniref:hypothetical protein n=1 Tax=unclassified Arthrobacter TaxID=235627 RepID=UPI0027D7DBCE|nr:MULTISPECIES: hypothetical protein [unclassified Arthrobacter]
MSTAREPDFRPDEASGVLKAMSPGVVDFLFRQLVAGEPAEDRRWQQEGTALPAQAPGAELARRLAETDLDALTPTELFNYVRAAQRLAAWAEGLRVTAVGRYCATPPGAAQSGSARSDASRSDAAARSDVAPTGAARSDVAPAGAASSDVAPAGGRVVLRGPARGVRRT